MSTATNRPPRDATEARSRFLARYGESFGYDWPTIARKLGTRSPEPNSVQGWMYFAEQARDLLRAAEGPAREHEQQAEQVATDLFDRPTRQNAVMIERMTIALERIAAALEVMANV